ncbi:MAG: ABC transporter permease [candidate division Zixibacteria bacterium]|nr:ABC transporter permease [candidate division Zixibacteria bacterium]
MRFRSTFSLSFDAIQAHKFRSFLTTLGVMFGVAAVIAMLSIGEGAKRDALEQIEMMGTSNIIIKAKKPPKTKTGESQLNLSEGLNLADAENIKHFSSLVENVVPQVSFKNVDDIQYKDRITKGTVIATTPEYKNLMHMKLVNGRFFTAQENEEAKQVCVLGYNMKKELFAFSNAIGKSIKTGVGYYFTVIGVLEYKKVGKSKIEGVEVRDINEEIYIPLEFMLKKIGKYPLTNEEGEDFQGVLSEIAVQVKKGRDIPEVAGIVQKVLERRHREVEDYKIIIPEALLRQSQRTQRIFNIVMGCIAGISLLVGGIGIMNIMLATVLERTREIGVRRAVGARKLDVMQQFLLEAVAISFVGCVLGVILGFVLAKGINFYAQWRTIISFGSVLLAVGVSAAVGIGFGYYPAKKAATLDPIEALRYE